MEEEIKKLRILYCANTFITQRSCDDGGYLGMEIASFEPVSGDAARLIFKCAKEIDYEIIIKPHNFEAIKNWKEFLKNNGRGVRARFALKRHKLISDYFKDSDVMVLSYFSSAVFEAMIYGIPVIFIDLYGLLGAKTERFVEDGHCKIARNETELKSILEELKNNK